MDLQYTKVGNDLLPELPDGWYVAVDTEGSLEVRTGGRRVTDP